MDDVEVISSLLQDSVLPVGNIEWDPRRRRLIMLVQRYCWECGVRGDDSPADDEEFGARIASAIRFDGVLRFRCRGMDPKVQDQAAVLLRLEFRPGDGPGGELRFLCSGNVEFSAHLECIDGVLMDISRPWLAAGRPQHPLDE